MTHLYEYFGGILGCSGYGKGFPSYNSTSSMYSVHRYMALNPFEVSYFIEQVGASAASWGVSPDDVKLVGSTLQSLFGLKCGAATSVLPGSPAELQSICIDVSCLLAIILLASMVLIPPGCMSPSTKRFLLSIRYLCEASLCQRIGDSASKQRICAKQCEWYSAGRSIWNEQEWCDGVATMDWHQGICSDSRDCTLDCVMMIRT